MSVVQERSATVASHLWTPDSVAGVCEAVRDAASSHTPLRIVGRGTWLDGGQPTSPDARALRVSALDGIIAYVPGDLTLTARAGTSLATIDAAAREKGQWVPLDPFCAAEDGGSIGATIATASAGPLALGLGLPRDVVLGLEAVTGEGVVVHTGGRVVKNVAGFDLTRLLTGAWGTLAVLTEVTIRLRGRPIRDETVAVRPRPARAPGRADDDPNDLGAFLRGLRGSPAMPVAFELVNERLAARLGLAGARPGPVALARLAGNAERVAAERAALGSIGDVAEIDATAWTALRRIEAAVGSSPAVVRWSQPASLLEATWTHATGICRAFPDALLHASIGRGIVRAIIPEPASAPLAAAIARDAGRSPDGRDPSADHRFPGSCIPERLPARLWGAAGVQVARDALSRRVRRAFDPAHVLNPGILGEGTDRD